MLNKYLLLTLCGIFLTACHNTTGNKDSMDLADFKVIEGTEIMTDADLLNPDGLVAIDSGILVSDYQDQYLLQYYRTYEDSDPQYLAEKGSGPNEFINTRNIYYNPVTDALTIYDGALKNITTYPVNDNVILDDDESYHRINVADIGVYEIMPLKSGFIGTGVFSGRPFVRINQEGDKISDFGSFPVDSTEIKDPFAFHLIFQSRIIANPQGTRMVSASPYCDWLAFYEINSDSGRLIKEYYSYPPKVKAEKPDTHTTHAILDSDCIHTYRHLSSTDNYVYLLYDGRTERDIKDKKFTSRYIMKYTWDGEFVDGYRFDEKIYDFTVTNDDSIIIGLVACGDDDVIIKSYNIK